MAVQAAKTAMGPSTTRNSRIFPQLRRVKEAERGASDVDIEALKG